MKNFISTVCLASFLTVALQASETTKPTLEIPEGFKHVGFILSPEGKKEVFLDANNGLHTKTESDAFQKGLVLAAFSNYRAD